MRDHTPALEPQTRTSSRSNKGTHSTKFADEEYSQNRHTARIAKTIDPDNELEPQTYNEAVSHPTRGKQWEKSIQEEYDSIIKNQTWTLVPRPKNRKVISCKWVFKHKKDEFGRINRLKSRLVARGFTQVYGVDYLDTFAPVAKLATIRALFGISAVEDLEMDQMDVVAAFLASELEEYLYMEQPEGFELYGENGELLVCLVRKSLYGFKQSARLWNRKLRRFLKKIGFYQLHSDHCVYINKETGVILAMWVDDLILFGKSRVEVDKMKDQLRSEFEMKDLGPLRYFVGILVQRDRERRTLRIDQSGYVDMILQRFDMENSTPVATPIATGTRLVNATDNDEIIDAKPYQSMVGSQMYAMLCTRPDIAFAVSQVSQFNASPTSTHEVIARRILRYLKGSMDLGIEYSGKEGLVMKVFVDADWGASENRRSIGGYIVILAGGAISWSCKKQGSVALSSTEAEYMALVQVLKESIWLQRLLRELGREAENAKTIYEDNQGAIALANNPEYHARTKHVDIQYHFVRECVENGDIELEYCPTADMVADALTKALPKDRHWMLLGRMGMKSATASSS
jgi:hypothetical protein